MPIRPSRVALLLLLAVLALSGCGAKDGATSEAKPEAFVGSWSFQDRPTANNPIREATITLSASGGSKLDVQGNLSTALVDFTIAGSGEVKDGKVTVDLDCAAEGGNWQAPGGTFGLTPESKLRATFANKSGQILSFELVKQ